MGGVDVDYDDTSASVLIALKATVAEERYTLGFHTCPPAPGDGRRAASRSLLYNLEVSFLAMKRLDDTTGRSSVPRRHLTILGFASWIWSR